MNSPAMKLSRWSNAIHGSEVSPGLQRANGGHISIDELNALADVDGVVLPEELDLDGLTPAGARALADAMSSGPAPSSDDLRLAHPMQTLPHPAKSSHETMVASLKRFEARSSTENGRSTTKAQPELLEKEARLVAVVGALLPVLAEIDAARARNRRH